MKPTVGPSPRCRNLLALASLAMFAGPTACGSDSSRADAGSGAEAGAAEAGAVPDAPLASEAGAFLPANTVSTCLDYASVTVGSYVVQANYWNKQVCPGTQCMDIDKSTGAFRVTKGPAACGDQVATYPNVLYGCSFGNCSPGSLLPMQVAELSSATSRWSFDVGGTDRDQYDVAYDIWFCPDNNCGGSGFPKGVELMIWLDYENVQGWENDLGQVTLAGHTWEVWQATMGSGADAWTYVAYLLKAPMVTSVTDLDINAFFRDLATRGYIQNDWYLYAIQAGNELRTGGIPYDNHSFSVSINGVTPSTTTPVVTPDAGPSCDGAMPSAQGTLSVADDYVTAGPLHGYGSAWTWVGGGSNAVACITPTCTAPGSLQVTATLNNGVAPLTAEPVSCLPGFASTALCTAGTVTADPSYNQVAGIGFNLEQALGRGFGADAGLDTDGGGESDGGASTDGGGESEGGAAGGMGSITIPNSIAVSVAKSGSLSGNSALRLQLTDVDDNFYCYGGALNSGVPIPIAKLNTQCWSNSGVYATPSTRFKRVDVLVPGSASTDETFAFCLTGVTVQ